MNGTTGRILRWATADEAEAALKELAVWLAEKPTADIADVIGPISSFVKALAQAAKDNAREEEAERRKKEAPKESGPKKYGGVGMFPAKGDANMMLEMQLKMAKRAERAAEQAGGGGASEAQQQQWLKRAELQREPELRRVSYPYFLLRPNQSFWLAASFRNYRLKLFYQSDGEQIQQEILQRL